jgi:hypothetical protein
VVTAGKDAQAGWLPLQDKMALLSSNSVHRVLPNVTHSSRVEDQHDSTGASSAIVDVVHAVRSGTGHEASTGIFSRDLAVRDASSSQRSADVRDDPGAGASGGNGIMLLALTSQHELACSTIRRDALVAGDERADVPEGWEAAGTRPRRAFL